MKPPPRGEPTPTYTPLPGGVPMPDPQPEIEPPGSIGGWLLVPLIFLALNGWQALQNVVSHLTVLVGMRPLPVNPDMPGASPSDVLGYLAFVTLGEAVTLVWSVPLLRGFINRRTHLPPRIRRFYLFQLGYFLAHPLVYHWLYSAAPFPNQGTLGHMLSPPLVALFWCYFRFSRRVNDTFTQ